MPPLVLEFRQSTRQHFVSRMSQATGHAGTVLIGGVGASLLGAPDPVLGLSVAAAASVPLLTFLWLWAFNSGRRAIPTMVVRLTATGIEVQRFDDVSFLPWTRFKGVRITWHPWRQIRLQATHGPSLTLDYYALDPEQRRHFLRELQEGTFRQLAAGEAVRDQRRQLRATGGQ